MRQKTTKRHTNRASGRNNINTPHFHDEKAVKSYISGQFSSPLFQKARAIKKTLLIGSLILTWFFVSFLSSLPLRAKTTSVVAFNSEYGLILIDSINSRAAFDLFETLNVPVQNGFYYQTKIFAPKDKSFRIACTAYSLNYICAVIVYPSQYSSLNFDTDEIKLKLPPHIAKNYQDKFLNAKKEFHFETEDHRFTLDWSKKGLTLRNYRKKGKEREHERTPKTIPLDIPGIEL